MRTVLETRQATMTHFARADALTSGPLLCTIAVHRRIGGVEQLPDFDSVHWHAQAVASLAAARMFGERQLERGYRLWTVCISRTHPNHTGPETSIFPPDSVAA